MRNSGKPLLIEIGEGLSVMVGLPLLTSWDIEGRPQSPKFGTVGFNTQTKSIEYWDGQNWYSAQMS